MATWEEMSRDCLKSAKHLLTQELFRRSISSSYYAAYSATTAELIKKGISFAHGWNNPSHDQLPELVLNNLGLPRNIRYELRKMLSVLRKARENADYRPNVSINEQLAREMVRLAQRIVKLLEENHGGTK